MEIEIYGVKVRWPANKLALESGDFAWTLTPARNENSPRVGQSLNVLSATGASPLFLLVGAEGFEPPTR